MLESFDAPVCVQPSDLDDAHLPVRSVRPEAWVTALAYFKAYRVACAQWRDVDPPKGTVLGADTVCVCGGRILGQPRDAADAARMIRAMRGREHQTITGVCLIDLHQRSRDLFYDVAVVRVDHISEAAIDAYITSGDWRGKAGGYNLSERLEAGWPIACTGDPDTVMGLPMRRLSPRLPRSSRTGIVETPGP